jgi:tetratricopeptide (TPR) repeat protein
VAPPRVFISHASQDKAAVEALAEGLKQRGIEVWLDAWELDSGHNFVASINASLDNATAGLIVCSEHARASRWVEAEATFLIHAGVETGLQVIPVLVADDAWVPPLLRPYLRCRVDEIDKIASALLGHQATPAPSPAPTTTRRDPEQVLITLRRASGPDKPEGIQVEVKIGGQVYGQTSFDALPREVVEGQAVFRSGFRTGLRRDAVSAERSTLDTGLVNLGRALRALCLPGDSAEALASLIEGAPLGTTVQVCVEAEGASLLGLPFEALRLPDDRLLATQAPVVMLRRPLGVQPQPSQPLAGPLKILVAVGAPDEGQTPNAVLDLERELQNILDAVERSQQQNFEVRILEVGHPTEIGNAIKADAYHVLHLSCHGGPGVLELEDEDGRAVPVTPTQLLAPIRQAGRPLPLVLLNACHTGVHDERPPNAAAPDPAQAAPDSSAQNASAPDSSDQDAAAPGQPAQDEQAASFAQALLQAGVPAVLAMLTSVSDYYATELARAFYRHLASDNHLLASRALADARKELEAARQQAIQRNDSLERTQPEYATASLFVAGEEQRLADFTRTPQPLSRRPVHVMAGPVPQLRMDDLIGRRKELRETMRTLRDPNRQYAGVVLTGLGGVGKSAVAGRAMQRLTEAGWLVAAHSGRFDLAAIARALGFALRRSSQPELKQLGQELMAPDLDDQTRLSYVTEILAQVHILLVLDDFERGLTLGGDAFLDPSVADYLETLAQNARAGRVLLTCRYPVPGTEAQLRQVPVGPLSLAETRKLLRRLPSFENADTATLGRLWRVIGGHPRMLEFLDAVLRGGHEARFPDIMQRLQRLLSESERTGLTTGATLDEGLQAALTLGMRDVLLDELLALAQQEGIAEPLLQAATSNLPVTLAGLARMLAADPDADDSIGDVPAAERALARLEELSLVHRFPDGEFWVHRWTAEGLARLTDPSEHQARFARAGRYRVWRTNTESNDLSDGIEAVRNFLAGQDFDAADAIVINCFDALRSFGQTIGIAALAAEVLESLPELHPGFGVVADAEAQAHLALGFTDRALRRYRALLDRQRQLVASDPGHAVYQRNLSVLQLKMGDLYDALGQRERARDAYNQAIAEIERLASAEPDRADYQRDLSISYNKMGDLCRLLGQREQAHAAYSLAFPIAERLASAEPDSTEYQRDLALSYERMGDLYSDDSQDEQARAAYGQAIAIRERLAAAEPDRAQLQQDVALSFERIGDLYLNSGKYDDARDAYSRAIAIRERLAAGEPDRADYRQNLMIPYARMGDLHRAEGRSEKARAAYNQALAIAEQLTTAEPDRADYQRAMMFSLVKISEVDESAANHSLQRALSIVLRMQERGQLPPVEEWIIAELQRRLQERGALLES